MYIPKRTRIRAQLRKSEEMNIGFDALAYHALFMDHVANALLAWQKAELDAAREPTAANRTIALDARHTLQNFATIIWAEEDQQDPSTLDLSDIL